MAADTPRFTGTPKLILVCGLPSSGNKMMEKYFCSLGYGKNLHVHISHDRRTVAKIICNRGEGRDVFCLIPVRSVPFQAKSEREHIKMKPPPTPESRSEMMTGVCYAAALAGVPIRMFSYEGFVRDPLPHFEEFLAWTGLALPDGWEAPEVFDANERRREANYAAC